MFGMRGQIHEQTHRLTNTRKQRPRLDYVGGGIKITDDPLSNSAHRQTTWEHNLTEKGRNKLVKQSQTDTHYQCDAEMQLSCACDSCE